MVRTSGFIGRTRQVDNIFDDRQWPTLGLVEDPPDVESRDRGLWHQPPVKLDNAVLTAI